MDEIQKLLDRGEVIVLFRNGLGSYTAAAIQKTKTAVHREIDRMHALALTHTDDFTPSKSLDRLAEKMLRTGDYRNWSPT